MTPPKAVRHLTIEEFCERVGIHRRTAENWRRDGRGPAYIKDGGVVRYRIADIEAWEKSRLVVPVLA